MANVFNSVKGLHPRRNAFSAHTYRNDFTSKLGVNIPVYQQHVTAGTRVKLGTAALLRLQALISPVMDNIDFYVHYWKIPYRLLENDRFTQFISGEIEQENYEGYFFSPREFSSRVVEEINRTSFSSGSARVSCYNAIFDDGGLLDFLGYDSNLFPHVRINGSDQTLVLVDGGNSTDDFNYRPLIAYYMLHLHWYMNENVPYFNDFDSLVRDVLDYSDDYAFAQLLIRTYVFFGTSMLPHGWEKDYFTSGLPNVQYGDPVTLGIAGNAPLTTGEDAVSLDVIPNQAEIQSDHLLGLHQNGGTVEIMKYTISNKQVVDNVSQDSEGGWEITKSPVIGSVSRNAQGYLHVVLNGQNLEGVYADLSEASAISINELRLANALQVFKERELRFGRRRLEYYKGFFDVTPEDLRLQVPQYLGGGRIPINISDIEQTSSTTEDQPLGRLAGKGTAVANGFAGFSTFCSEESIIIGIGFAMPHITYANSVSRFLLKTNDRYDYFNPSFEHLGEQAIKNIEVYAGAPDPDRDFAYTPRFNEYRFHLNEMHGQFKSTLAFWSLGRIFSSQPALNAEFIYMQPSVFDRIFAVADQDNLIASMLFHVRLIQPVSKYGTPRIMV